MPIYEFICNNCKKEFEMLIYKNEEAKCPNCNSNNLTKKFSVFSSFSSESSENNSCDSCDMSENGSCPSNNYSHPCCPYGNSFDSDD